MPPAVRALHAHFSPVVYSGHGSVERGRGWASRALGWLMRFPPATAHTPVRVEFDISPGRETWTRHFGGHSFRSTLRPAGGELVESFGWVRVAFRLTANESGLEMHAIRWSALGMPLPRFLWPAIVAQEREADDRFHFHVEASMPGMGLVVRYSGMLAQSGGNS